PSCRSRSPPAPAPTPPAPGRIRSRATPVTATRVDNALADELCQRGRDLAQLLGVEYRLRGRTRLPLKELLAVAESILYALDPEIEFMWTSAARDLERFLHQGLGFVELPEACLADPLLQIVIRPDVGRHVRGTLLAALPPARETDAVTAERRAVHQFDQRVVHVVLSSAPAD